MAYVTNSKGLRSTFVPLKLTTDRHKASRSLFATAELLVDYVKKLYIGLEPATQFPVTWWSVLISEINVCSIFLILKPHC